MNIYEESTKMYHQFLDMGRPGEAEEKRNTNVICKIWKSCVEKNPNIKVHSATSYLIFQYLQYWYLNQYFPESSSICNTGITSIFQNLPVSAILVLPVFPRILQYLQYWYYQYFPESSGIYNTHILPMTSIF